VRANEQGPHLIRGGSSTFTGPRHLFEVTVFTSDSRFIQIDRKSLNR
jgi:hypothetical protein